ncbi:enoyl-CoA hydratase [Pseudomonas sp. G11-1]|uniref:Enoyl-CoA hydratase n=1 Tax=Halopseudomonas bauzanensis TaxID=653930 RepID=A0A4U0YHT4_9GAMM|nr:enoyl-CoA hydratase [Halopseudomonas bauzanensis]MCO5785049.1 enoyl-CoA hydratase [Pseudomonas sp. G11-1]MCO5788848.1 enoyl-CoA hydratase [Pseudomonas sp. G11-2]TKA90765.1 enoyl-CoA hydratase [Halopseudomonas bauzanensis]
MSEVTTELSGGILTITISRPDKKNALTNAMYGALADALERAEAEAGIRVVVFQADGEIFSAGNDLGDFTKQSTGDGPAVRHVERFLNNLVKAGKPVMAAVQGKAVGVGTTMLLHCDYVLLAEDAQLIAPFINLALVPEAGSSLLMPLRIGHVRAFEMFALGEPVSAQDAHAWGIANKVVSRDTLRSEVQRIATLIAEKPAGAVALAKGLMRNTDAVLAQMEQESGIFSAQLRSAEAKEAFRAFAEKRKPDFTSIGKN